MLAAAALVPDTVLLLPGAAGRGPDDPELVALRSAAATAVARAVERAPRVVVVAPGSVDRSVVGVVRAGAGAAGVPDHLLADEVPQVRLGPAPGGPPDVPGPPGTGAVTGLRLALDAGVPPERLHVVEVAPGRVAPLRAVGAAASAVGPTALVVVGSGAARHGQDAPLPHDERAAGLEHALLAAFRAGGAAARDALAGLDVAQAVALGVTGWAPWQVLVGALDAGGAEVPAPEVVHAVVWRGAAHAVVAWQGAS
ncbi:hypothetical protein [Cellulomonas xiejunii]|uniref:Extradiol ring-cleavage dioxygenase class III enzyme subunit B domain-containing protein n=1 Tax=Cellulomonas xiejunii TaxID=2968083 RepID=A0ABY5KY75_9CELL|nr:hypothetical protein [Cellulomonas xiejunii]MCC2322019.1 hypothetical protein [Cellulomonas xiejunii]UUI73313.1 hypothetical protein NP048_07735 [Cellulomonas xiejunii]